jgi:hypothetical protein
MRIRGLHWVPSLAISMREAWVDCGAAYHVPAWLRRKSTVAFALFAIQDAATNSSPVLAFCVADNEYMSAATVLVVYDQKSGVAQLPPGCRFAEKLPT